MTETVVRTLEQGFLLLLPADAEAEKQLVQ
jgi:hypothetical protein